eukprot:TRINITY_DN49114_c0_g1_i1.p1 TRINITY_DN49114_c0_g1~~TRINITY_DN49114_c0_g1_i1.p1  ORF type:complete len:313 (-),score=52.03 TRINITY_DN49114_c0_g1_i1:55-993(-)
MLATDPFITAKFPHYLATDEELSLTADLLDKQPSLKDAFRKYICIGEDSVASLRRFCWQAKQSDLKDKECAEEAIRLLNLCMAHRTKLSLNSIIETPTFIDDYWKTFVQTVPQTYHGVGKRGQPIVVIRLGHINPEAMGKLLDQGNDCGAGDTNAAVLCFLRCEEYLLRRQVTMESKKVGHLTDRIILVLDLWGLGVSHFRVLKDFWLAAVKQTVLLYPETLDKLMVTNAAWIMANAIWPLIKQVLHPVTQAKVRMLDAGGTKAGLLEEIDESVLPSCFGGEAEGIHLGELLNLSREVQKTSSNADVIETNS